MHPVKRRFWQWHHAVYRRLNRWMEMPAIVIAPTAHIQRSAVVEVRGGGTIRVGDDTEIWDYACLLTYGGDIRIGQNCSINPFTIIYGHGGTYIGDNVLIAGHCMIIPNHHNFTDPDTLIRMQGHTSRGIRIENDVWIGHGCSILDGVTIGTGSVIAAGSVVHRNVPPFSVFGGVPARKIKSRRPPESADGSGGSP